jgi:hypothetical protein
VRKRERERERVACIDLDKGPSELTKRHRENASFSSE